MTPLHQFGEAIRQALLNVPLGVARGLFILLFAVLLIWVLTLPRSQTTPPDRTPRFTENLKVWAAVSLIIQLLIYSLL